MSVNLASDFDFFYCLLDRYGFWYGFSMILNGWYIH